MNPDKDLLDDVYQRAFEYEARLGSCPQCVLAALQETIKIGDENVSCGALAGGMIAIGLLVGRTYKEFSEGQKKRLVFKYTRMLYDRFVEEYGSPLCCGVQKKIFGRSYNLLDKQEYESFENAGAHVDKCTSVAGNAARWTAELILNELQKENAKG